MTIASDIIWRFNVRQELKKLGYEHVAHLDGQALAITRPDGWVVVGAGLPSIYRGANRRGADRVVFVARISHQGAQSGAMPSVYDWTAAQEKHRPVAFPRTPREQAQVMRSYALLALTKRGTAKVKQP